MLNSAHLVSIVQSAQFLCMLWVAQLDNTQVAEQPPVQLALQATIALISHNSQLLVHLVSFAQPDQSSQACALSENLERLLS